MQVLLISCPLYNKPNKVLCHSEELHSELHATASLHHVNLTGEYFATPAANPTNLNIESDALKGFETNTNTEFVDHEVNEIKLLKEI